MVIDPHTAQRRLGLRETPWLRLPLQPTTSNSGALLTFAHCPNFKLQAA
jgi:hypothetical protein